MAELMFVSWSVTNLMMSREEVRLALATFLKHERQQYLMSYQSSLLYNYQNNYTMFMKYVLCTCNAPYEIVFYNSEYVSKYVMSEYALLTCRLML